MAATLLSLRGRATLYTEGVACVLACRYRKGLALLGFLARHPGRIQRREAMADLLWPDLESAAGRANLRVVLADLVSVLRRQDLADLLEVQRDTLAWRPAERLLLDMDWLASAGARQHGTAQSAELDFLATEALQGPWLAGAEEGSSEEFIAWLDGQRTLADMALAQASTVNEHARTTATQAAALLKPALTAPLAAVSYTTLALLRVELAEVSASDDQPWRADMAALLATLQTEASHFDGQLLESDDVGCTFGFGVHSHHTGQRWQALRCAAALAAWHPDLLRTGVTAGRVLLTRTPALHAFGWRMRLVERLARRAEAGELACDESLADLAAYLGCRPDGVQRFRGLDRGFQVFRQMLPPVQELEWMLPPPGDFAQCCFGRDALLQSLVEDFMGAAGAPAVTWCLSGDAGMGKTRTAWECAQRLRQQGRRVFWLTGRPERHGTPWYGLRELARSLVAAGPAEGCPAAQGWQALDAFAATGAWCADNIDALAATMAVLLRSDTVHACLVVVDDAHWLDDATAGLLYGWARAPGTHWLMTCRSALPAPLVRLPVRLAPLESLDDGAADAILVSLPGGSAMAPAARRGRIASARGIPLYLLADAVSSRQGSHFADFCSARFDALEACGPAVLAAAVLGMLFSRDDLAALCGHGAAQQAVDRATAAGLLVLRGPDAAAFFHARLRTYLLDTAPRDALVGYALAAAALRGSQGQHAQSAALLEMAAAPQQASRAWFRAALQPLAQDDLEAALEHCSRMSRVGSLVGVHGVRGRRLQALCVARLMAPPVAARAPAPCLTRAYGPRAVPFPSAATAPG